MNQFAGFGEFAAFLAGRIVATEAAIHHGLDVAGRIIVAQARSEIGVPQPHVGPFPEWQPLADTTMEGWHGHPGKIELGYVGHRSAQDPLLRTGALRDSYSHTVSGNAVTIGSDSDVAVWQETGTAKIPPRPVIGPAAVHRAGEVVDVIAKEIVSAIAGGIRSNHY